MTENKNVTPVVSGRRGVVLAAGLGSRLAAEGASSSLKPLTLVKDVPLMFRTLRSLELAGCERVLIILGHAADTIRTEIEAQYTGTLPLDFVVNPEYRLKNGVTARYARPFVKDEFILTMADHVFSDDLMARVRAHHPPVEGATLCVDFDIDGVFDLDDATKVQAEDNRLIDISKTLEHYNCIDTGLFICTPALLDALDRVYAQKGDVSRSEGIAELAQTGRMQVFDIEDAFWQDVDTPEMHAHAETLLAEPARGL